MSIHPPHTAWSHTAQLPAPSSEQRLRSCRTGGAVLVLGGVVLLTGLLVVPGPDAADVHQSTWLPGHALHAVGFLLLAIGMPALARSFEGRLGPLGLVGYAAVMTRLVLSTGSHLYSMWTLPALAALPALKGHLGNRDHDALASIYSAHNTLIGVVIGGGVLCLAIALWRIGRPLRTAAVLLALAAVCEAIEVPLSLVVLAVLGCWLGLRLILRGDAVTPIRTGTAS